MDRLFLQFLEHGDRVFQAFFLGIQFLQDVGQIHNHSAIVKFRSLISSNSIQ